MTDNNLVIVVGPDDTIRGTAQVSPPPPPEHPPAVEADTDKENQ